MQNQNPREKISRWHFTFLAHMFPEEEITLNFTMDQLLMCCHNIATRRLVYNGSISKIRINNSMASNFGMKVDHNLNLGPHRLNSERVIAVQSLKTSIIH